MIRLSDLRQEHLLQGPTHVTRFETLCVQKRVARIGCPCCWRVEPPNCTERLLGQRVRCTCFSILSLARGTVQPRRTFRDAG